MSKTLLAIGAHHDDCVFGIPGIMLKAIQKKYRVIILSLLGTAYYKDEEFFKKTIAICREYGADLRYWTLGSHRFDLKTESRSLENKHAFTEMVADINPDIAFTMWPYDTHPDHGVTYDLSKIALVHGDKFLKGKNPAKPQAIYLYDNGPSHTIGFQPDTYVDISDVWSDAVAWLGKMVAISSKIPYNPEVFSTSQRAKETLAQYRGIACGVKYSEAVTSFHKQKLQEIL